MCSHIDTFSRLDKLLKKNFFIVLILNDLQQTISPADFFLPLSDLLANISVTIFLVLKSKPFFFKITS